MDQRNDKRKLKRRDFLALGAAGVAGAALVGGGGSKLAYAAETKAPPPTLMMFPGNYTWSAAVRGVISGMPRGGGDMGEVYKVCAALQDKAGDNAAWFTEWNKMGEHVAALGDEAKAKGYTSDRLGCIPARGPLHSGRGEAAAAPHCGDAESLCPCGRVV